MVIIVVNLLISLENCLFLDYLEIKIKNQLNYAFMCPKILWGLGKSMTTNYKYYSLLTRWIDRGCNRNNSGNSGTWEVFSLERLN